MSPWLVELLEMPLLHFTIGVLMLDGLCAWLWVRYLREGRGKKQCH